jgi:outer membrane protein TolC
MRMKRARDFDGPARCLILVGLGLFISCGSAAAQQPLTLAETVRRALHRGFQMEVGSLDVAISREEVVVARSAFDPRISAEVQESVSRVAARGPLPASTSAGTTSAIGISKSLSSGATIGIATTLDRSRSNSAISLLNPAYASGVSLALRQPLLQGFGSSVSAAGLRAARIGAASAEADQTARALDVVRAAEAAYDRLAGARAEAAVLGASLDLALRLEIESQSRRAAGTATRLDVLQARLGVSRAREGVELASAAVASAEEALLALTGRFELDEAVGEVSFPDIEPPHTGDIPHSYRQALQREPGLLSARAALDLAQLDVTRARDALKPRVDLDLALGFAGDEGEAGDAVDAALQSQRSSWQAGLSFTHVVGREAERARYRQAEAALRRQRLIVQMMEQDLEVRVRDAVRAIATAERSVSLADEAVRWSGEQLGAAFARFRAGLGTSREVLEAQVDLQLTRQSRLRARLAARDGAGRLRRIEGSGLEHYGLGR